MTSEGGSIGTHAQPNVTLRMLFNLLARTALTDNHIASVTPVDPITCRASPMAAAVHVDAANVETLSSTPTAPPPRYQSPERVPIPVPVLENISSHPIFRHVLSPEQRRGVWNTAPIDARSFRSQKNPTVPGSTLEAARQAHGFLPWATENFPSVPVPVWLTQGDLAGTFEWQRVGFHHRAAVRLPERRRMPPPVFPEGTLDEIISAANSGGPFYVVTKGFRIGVYTTWEYGARLATDNCPGAHFTCYNCEFYIACRIFMDAVKHSNAHIVRFHGDDY
jgi:hypothetical protein